MLINSSRDNIYMYELLERSGASVSRTHASSVSIYRLSDVLFQSQDYFLLSYTFAVYSLILEIGPTVLQPVRNS